MNQVYGEKHWNQDGHFIAKHNSVFRVQRDDHNLYYSRTSQNGVNTRAYNNEIADSYRNGQHLATYRESERFAVGYKFDGIERKYGVELSREDYFYGQRFRTQIDFHDPYYKVKVLLGANQFTSNRAPEKKYMSYEIVAEKTFTLTRGELTTGLRAMYTPDNLDKYQMQMNFEYFPGR